MNIRAALLTAHNAPLTLATLEPLPLTYGQVLVRILASGICGAQLQELDGHKKTGPMPHPLGHEGVGIVEEVGPAVRQVKVGDKVVMHWRKGDGIESEFPRYLLPPSLPLDATWADVNPSNQGAIITGGKVTTFSDFSVCSENRLTPVPPETPVELCALLGCSLSTALGVIENEANLKMGESVLIIGCGGLGLNLILAARMRMAGSIIGMDIKHEKLHAVLAFGARFEVTGLCPHKETFDVVIDTTGDPEAMDSGLSRLAPSGRFIMVGQPRPGVSVPVNNARHLFSGEGCSIKATQGGCFQPSRDIPRYIRAYEAGHLKVDGIVTHRMGLDFVNDAIALVRNGEAGRVLLIP